MRRTGTRLAVLSASAVVAAACLQTVATSAQAAPCGYYASGGRGYLHNCNSYSTAFHVEYYTGIPRNGCVSPGSTIEVGRDSNIAWAALSGRCP
jgi:hypothetical protein